jgi:hypothetical protein
VRQADRELLEVCRGLERLALEVEVIVKDRAEFSDLGSVESSGNGNACKEPFTYYIGVMLDIPISCALLLLLLWMVRCASSSRPRNTQG